MVNPSEDDLRLYGARLYGRREQAVMLQWANFSSVGWLPRPNECHRNVTEVCEHDESYSPVRGWLYFDFGGLLAGVKFVAHSALRSPNGILYDITPARASQQYPFIVAEEPEAEYASLVESGVTQLWHVK
jgi:hypothetical protein